jgi:hypothetical protein
MFGGLCCKTRSFLSAIVGLEFGVSTYPASPLRELGIEASAALANAPATPGKQLQTMVGHARAA